MTPLKKTPEHKEIVREIGITERISASITVKTLRQSFNRTSVAAQLWINRSYVSMIEYMSKTPDGKYWAPKHAVLKVLAWSAQP